MKILIINLHSSCNAGDAALALVSIEHLLEEFPGAGITLSMNDPQSHQGPEPVIGSFLTWFGHQNESHEVGVRWWALPWLLWLSWVNALIFRLSQTPSTLFVPTPHNSLLRAYFEADMVVSCPGNMLYSQGRIGYPILVSLYAMSYALLAGKPLYMLPQSIGPLHRAWERILVKWVLAKMRVATIREPVSYQQLKQMGVSLENCHLIPDVAFAFKGAGQDEADQFFAKLGLQPAANRPLLGITVVNWQAQNRRFDHQNRYEEAIAGLALAFINEYQGHVVFFTQVWGPTVSQDDRVPSQRIVERLQSQAQSVTFIKEPISPSLLKSAYGCMDLFVGTRMHSNIFALSEGTPVLAIGYLHKTAGIMRMIGLEDWMIDINKVNTKDLASRLHEVWTAREKIKAHLANVMPATIKEIRQATQLIAQDFNQGRKPTP